MVGKGYHAAILAALLLVFLLSCGTKRSAIDFNGDSPLENRLSQAIIQAQALPQPSQLQDELWQELVTELVRVLKQRQEGELRATNMLPPPPDFGVEQGVLYWTQCLTGDYDNNGEVNVADLTPLGIHFGEDVPPGTGEIAALGRVDGDDNYKINIADITPIGVHYGETVTGYSVLFSEDASGSSTSVAARLDPPDHETGPMADTPVYSYAPTSSGYYSVMARGVGQSGMSRTAFLEVDLGVPGPDPDPNPDPNPDPDPDPDPDPLPDLDPDPLPGQGVVSGRLVDPNGNPVGEGSIVIPGYGPVQANEQGYFIMPNIGASANAPVGVRAAGFANTVGITRVDGFRERFMEFVVLPREFSGYLSGSAGGALDGSMGAKVNIPANSVVDKGGNPLTGTLSVSLTPVGVADESELATVPGNFQARMLDSSSAVLESFGMMELFIDDGLGNAADIAPGEEIEIEIPVPQALRGTSAAREAPETVGLYSFDEAAGQWIEEGEMELNDEGTAYVGQTQSTGWKNPDKPIYNKPVSPPPVMTVNVIDRDAAPVVGAEVCVSGVDYYCRISKATGQDGAASTIVKANSQIRLFARMGDELVSYDKNIQTPGLGQVCSVDLVLNPVLFSATLTWGDAPDDLDIHMLLPVGTAGSSSRAHCYWHRMDVGDAMMDTDDRFWFGPERITAYSGVDGVYDVYVYDASQDFECPLQLSQAKLTVGGSNCPTLTVSAPSSNPYWYYTWHAFQIVVSNDGQDIEVTPINKYVELPPEMYFEH